MAYRLVGHAQERIDGVLLESARHWGLDAAERYHRLILAAMAAVSEIPLRPGSRPIAHSAAIRTYHLRLARGLMAPDHRVREPRHLVVYRLAPDGVVEILSLVHDRMQLPRAARQARRAADQ